MRCGDVYRIQNMVKAGITEAEIVHKFRNSYSEEDIKRFLPKPKKAVKKKATKK